MHGLALVSNRGVAFTFTRRARIARYGTTCYRTTYYGTTYYGTTYYGAPPHQRHRGGGGGVPARRRPPRSPPPRRPSPRPTPLKQRWAPAASIANGVGAPGLRRATGHRRHVGGGGVPSRRRSPRSPPREARWAQPAMPLREGDVRTFGLLSAGERRLGHVGAVWSVSCC